MLPCFSKISKNKEAIMLEKLYKDPKIIDFIKKHTLYLYFSELISESYKKGHKGKPLRLRLAIIISFLRCRHTRLKV